MANTKRSIINNIGYLVRKICIWDNKVLSYFGLYTVVTAIIPFTNIFAPKFLIDELMGENRIVYLIGILLSYFVISATLNYLNSLLEGAYSPRLIGIGFQFANLINEKCMKMDFKYTEDRKILNDIETAERAVSGASMGIEAVLRKIFGIFGAGAAFLGYVAIVLSLSPLVLLYLIVNVTVIYYLTTKVKKYEYGKKNDISELNRKSNYIYNLMYDFTYGKDIRIFNLGRKIADKYRMYTTKKIGIYKNIRYRYFKSAAADAVLLLIREGIVYAYLIYKVLYSGMGIGNFALYSATIAGFAAWMQRILEDIAHINAQNLYINDYRNFLETDLEIESLNYTEIPKEDTYEIEFKNVSFKYPNSERYVYKDLSLKISKGQKLAIVGINGAGKTTLVKLLTRLYEPSNGEILLNGINISKFKKEEYYRLFSVVFQEIKMFAFSIAENIALKDKEFNNKEKVMESIEMAGMREKINSLENGIDTPLLKTLDPTGIDLSGGEKQKLALARGLYKDGPVVILDEPTAALDPIAESNIYKSFNSMIGDKTAIFISHRLASTRFCDVIAFFEDGEIQEYGTHDELLMKNGKYAEMFNIQTSYYREDRLAEEGA